MLIQFSVRNFMSIKNEVILSMSAGKDRAHRENLISFEKEAILPSAAIYGANAAGKSNISKAMTAALIIIRSSNTRQINEKIPMITPFMLDDTSRFQPSHFDFIFTFGGRKYAYGFSADADKVSDEYLYEYRTARPSKVFERTNTRNYWFTKKDEREFSGYVEKTSDNKLFLATATAWNCNRTKDPYLWLAEGLDTYDGNSLQPYAMDALENDEDGSLKRFLTELLQKADINISGYAFKTRDITGEEIAHVPLPPGIDFSKILEENVAGKIKQYEIVTDHLIETEAGVKNFQLPFAIESEGTKHLFFFGTIIKKALEKGKTIIIDEIDNSLHPLLVNAIIGLFNNKEFNPFGAQLIFNTHDVSLLNLDIFRRDQVYFTEKASGTGITDLYSLDEFSPRKTENIRKGYLQGRYGAIPVIELGDQKW
jgi:AAA15 family ATPase/GTPase